MVIILIKRVDTFMEYTRFLLSANSLQQISETMTRQLGHVNGETCTPGSTNCHMISNKDSSDTKTVTRMKTRKLCQEQNKQRPSSFSVRLLQVACILKTHNTHARPPNDETANSSWNPLKIHISKQAQVGVDLYLLQGGLWQRRHVAKLHLDESGGALALPHQDHQAPGGWVHSLADSLQSIEVLRACQPVDPHRLAHQVLGIPKAGLLDPIRNCTHNKRLVAKAFCPNMSALTV